MRRANDHESKKVADFFVTKLSFVCLDIDLLLNFSK